MKNGLSTWEWMKNILFNRKSIGNIIFILGVTLILFLNLNYFNNVYLWKSYLGFTPEIIEFRDSGYLSEMDEVKSMPCYQEDGSIAIVGDTVVIKASEIADK